MAEYPSAPEETEGGLKYKIAVIADLDKGAKMGGGKFFSYFKRGSLTVKYDSEKPSASKVDIEWDEGEPSKIISTLNFDGRGMELSELNVYNGQMLSVDDRTGIVFRLLTNESGDIHPVAWAILADGDGNVSKGFKCEWGCTKDGDFWVGSTGMAFVDVKSQQILNLDPRWVKRISPSGGVTHVNWLGNYERLAKAIGIVDPGYVKHESGGWSDKLNKWMFLPRRACKEMFNGNDEDKGTNVLLLASEDFEDIEVRYVGEVIPTHGFSSFKWIPGTDDQLVVALKTVESDAFDETYVMVFDMDGNILLEETKIADAKYEGIEFV